MVYGIISQADGATTRAYFKNKRVPDANVVHIVQLPSLFLYFQYFSKFKNQLKLKPVSQFPILSDWYVTMSAGGSIYGWAMGMDNGKGRKNDFVIVPIKEVSLFQAMLIGVVWNDRKFQVWN